MSNKGSKDRQEASIPMLAPMMIPDDQISITARSKEVGGSSEDAGGDRGGAMPLLGLEPTVTEKLGENSNEPKDSNQGDLLAPLLGTICSI